MTLTVQDNYFILNGTNNGTESVFQLSNYITPFKTNANTKLKAFQISGTASGSLTNTLFRTYSNWGNQVNVNFTRTTMSSYSAELTYNNCMLALAGGTYTDYKIGIMVADNLTSDDTFEPYQEPKTYQLSLGEYEFAKIGNYRDYIWTDRSTGKWYKKNVINKKVLNGTESYSSMGWTDKSAYRTTITDLKQTTSASESSFLICDYFIAYSQNGLFATDNNGISNRVGQSEIILRNDNWANSSALITWLSTNLPKLYYVLVTPTDIEITGTLADQLEQFYYSQSFTGTTIITSNGDLPLIIKVRGLKGE